MSATAVSPEVKSSLIRALQKLGGHATLGDVVSATALPAPQAEDGLKSLLESYRGHLEVSDSGDLLYRFGRRLMRRDHLSGWMRFKKTAWAIFKTAFKVWTAVMLVAYFVIFVLLLIAALAANRDDKGFGGRRGGFGLGDALMLHWLMGGSGWSRGSLYYGDHHARRLPKDARPPFYKKVFAFIFGPEEPRPTRLQKDRSTLQLIRARRGVLTTAELVEHTGLPMHKAEEEMGRLTGAYGGDPEVSAKGEVVYAFPELMKSVHGKVVAKEPKPAWLRLEYPKKVTGNSGKANFIIGGMNAFNLVAGSVILSSIGMTTAPELMPPVDPLIQVGLGVVPVVFSGMFFGIPLLRSFGVRGQNANRLRRNVRRLLVGLVYGKSIGTVGWVSIDEAIRSVQKKLGEKWGSQVSPRLVIGELEKLAAEFDADVETDDAGHRFRFPKVRLTFVEAELMRRSLKLQDQKIGQIVYSSGDTSKEANERELAAFNRELAETEIELSGYLPSPGAVGYEEDFEVVLDEPVTVAARTTSRRRGRRQYPPRWQ